MLLKNGACLRRAGGTKADFEKKKTKLEQTIKYLMEEHKTKDKEDNKFDISEEEKDARIKKLQNKIEKITKWMKENKDKEGSKGNAIKSNITDNDSANLPAGRQGWYRRME
jgi:hypothetical protein